jgi:uncharacterized protein (DUF2384 family)
VTNSGSKAAKFYSTGTVNAQKAEFTFLKEPTMPRTEQIKPLYHDLIFQHAHEVLCSEQAAQDWLHARQSHLGNRRPVDLLNTAEGMRCVRAALNGIL